MLESRRHKLGAHRLSRALEPVLDTDFPRAHLESDGSSTVAVILAMSQSLQWSMR
jgi:hypothetical protein